MGLAQVQGPINIIWAVTVRRPLKWQRERKKSGPPLSLSRFPLLSRCCCLPVVGGCRNLVAEHWRLKPEALGLIPSGTTFLSFPLLFQRSLNSDGPDNLYQSSDLGEPHLSASLCCDEAQIPSKSHTAIITCQVTTCFYAFSDLPKSFEFLIEIFIF